MPSEFVLRCINAIRQLLDEDQMVSFMAKDNSVDDVIDGKFTFRIRQNDFPKTMRSRITNDVVL